MSWICKECGGKIVRIDVVPYIIIREIKENGKPGKNIVKKEHDTTHSSYYHCLDCKEKAPVVYKDSLKMIAELEE